MVDTQHLAKKIEDSGLKTSYIVDKLGISRQAFDATGESLERQKYMFCVIY